MNGGEALVALLEQLHVEVVFGLCGDTSLPWYEALADAKDQVRHVLTRDERSASYMADAYARLSGRVGVCEGPSGGGATYILPGVAEANDSSVPLVCLTSDIATIDRGKGTLTEMDQQALFSSVTKRTFAPTRSGELPGMIRDAFREATTGSLGACQISLPMDIQVGSVDSSEVHADPVTARYPSQRLAPDPDAVKRAGRFLADSRRPLLVAGAGVLRSGAWEEVTALARALGAPLATSICGKGAIAETDPLSLGVIGSNGGLPYRHDLVRKADVIFYLGCGLGSVTTEKWTLPTPGQATILQLDTNPEIVGRSYPVAAFVHSDAKSGVDALLEELGGPGEGDRVDPREIAEGRAVHQAQVAELFASGATPVRPERMFAELFDALPEDAVLIADPGTPCPYLSAYWELPRAGRWCVSPRAFGALGYALPGVVGAYFAKPDAGRVVGVMGDGSFGISAGELETIVRLDVPVTLIVCNNAGYGWIKAGQKSRGSTFHSVDFRQSDHAAIARAYGMSALRVEDPTDLGGAMREALTAPGPFLLDVVMQPLEEANAPVSKWIA